MAIAAPPASSRSTTARPIPCAPPVMTADRLLKSYCIGISVLPLRATNDPKAFGPFWYPITGHGSLVRPLPEHERSLGRNSALPEDRRAGLKRHRRGSGSAAK